MGNISVYYNGSGLSPVPFVTQEYKFIDYNGTRWGNVLEITLNGVISGLTTTGNVSQITNLFASQFGQIQIYQNSNSGLIYNWQNVIIEEISFPNSHYYLGTATPYTVRGHCYNTFSGVTEPVNQYDFAQNEDGTVNVVHKISARGIRNSGGAFNNAVSFVKQFTGKQPYSNCASFFVPSGSGILVSMSEKNDRINGTYGVTEIYKYTTGQSLVYTFVSNLDINDSIDQTYLILDYDVKFKGSPFGNIATFSTGVASFNEMNDILAFGVQTGLLVQISSDLSINSGAAEASMKYSYYSGYSSQDLTGFFDYDVSLKKDFLIPKETWEIKGNFVCRGPLIYKIQQLNAFKSEYKSDWRGYLTSLISGSPIWSGLHTSGNLLGINPNLSIHEITGMAVFEASLSISDGAEIAGLPNSKYNVEIEPGKWEFDLMPAANIEGHYIVQDLQMQSQSKLNLSLTSDAVYPYTGLAVLSGLLNNLATIYVKSGFLIESQYTTGINDISCENHWIGQDSMNTGLLNIKMVGSNNFAFTRISGYDFGY